MKYSNLTNTCNTTYKEMQNAKKFNKMVSVIGGIIPNEIIIKIAIEFNKNAYLLYFFEQSSYFCS